MGNDSNPKEWSDERIIEYLCSYWECDDFVFDCTIDDKPYKTSRPENYKGAIRNISYNRKLICYPNGKYPIFFNISAIAKFQFQKGQFKMRFELDSRERRERRKRTRSFLPARRRAKPKRCAQSSKPSSAYPSRQYPRTTKHAAPPCSPR